MSTHPAATTLYYIHDPMCSWCWGFAPVLAVLVEHLPANIKLGRLLGGLAPDSDEPMPGAMQAMLQDTWRRIEQTIPGTHFNFDFWRDCQPRRSTYPACRAVVAARQQGDEYDAAMTRAIQRAYYLQARNPSDDSTLIALACELGLDAQRFSHDLVSAECHRALLDEIGQARALQATSFPSLVLQAGNAHWPVPVDYTDAAPIFSTIESLLG